MADMIQHNEQAQVKNETTKASAVSRLWRRLKRLGRPAAPAPASGRLPIFRNGCFYPPHKNSKHVAGPREKALRDFWNNEAGKREQELRAKFREFLECIDKAAGDHLCAHAVSALGRDADTMFSVSCMQEGMYCARDMGEAAFKDAMRLAHLHMRMATSIATALSM